MELTIADLKPFLPGLEAAFDDEAVSEVMINEPAAAFVECADGPSTRGRADERRAARHPRSEWPNGRLGYTV